MQSDINFKGLKTSPSNEELIEDVKRCVKLVAPNFLSALKYNEIGKYHSDIISRRFGNRKRLPSLKLINENEQD